MDRWMDKWMNGWMNELDVLSITLLKHNFPFLLLTENRILKIMVWLKNNL